MTTLLEENTVLEHTSGMTSLSTQVTGEKIKYLVSVYIHGKTAGAMKENGLKTIWKVWESTFGTMAENMKANIRMIKSMATVFTLGLIRDVTWAIGIRENNMDSVLIQFQKILKLSSVFGKMEKELNGLMKLKSKL